MRRRGDAGADALSPPSHRPTARRKGDIAAIAGGAAIGLCVAAVAVPLAILSGGAGHGDYVAARLLFPGPLLFMPIEGTMGPLTLGAGLLQFPVYGALIGRGLSHGSWRGPATMVAFHTVAAIACFAGALSRFV